MCGPAKCFDYRLRTVGSHGSRSKGNCSKCVNGSSRTRSSKTSPTPSRSKFAVAAALVLLTCSAATLFGAELLPAVSTRDSKIIKRWTLAGDPHGIALGADGTIYVGLAQPQSVIAIDG